MEWRNHVRPLPITTFLTHEGSRLVPRPLKNWNEASRLFVNLEFQKLSVFMLARLLLLSHDFPVVAP